MKRFFFVLILVGGGITLGLAYREISKHLLKKREHLSSKVVYATHPIIKNFPFTIIMAAQNNSMTCERTLLSVLNQNYDNFRLIYIDDASADGSYETVSNFLSSHQFEDRLTLIRNDEHQGTIESLYRAIHSCNSKEIVLLLREGEFLAHENVLSRLNEYYANPDVWLTQSDALAYPTYEKDEGNPHVRSFFASLFHRIKLEDFLKEGAFLSENEGEVLLEQALRELGWSHLFFTPDTFYITTSHFDEGEVPEHMTYTPFKGVPTDDFIQDEEYVDIVAFSYDRPLQLYAFLESVERHLINLHRIFVIYRSENDHYEACYQKVKKDFPKVIYIKHNCESPHKDFATTFVKTAFDKQLSPARYVAFALDDNIIRGSIDMKEAVSAMKETGAYGFYFLMGSHLSESPEKPISIGNNIFAWQFSEGKGDWACPNSVNMALFKKEDIQPNFLCMQFHNPNTLEALWNQHADLSRIGLYYGKSKVVKAREKIAHPTDKGLLTLFDQGLKLDIMPLSQIANEEVEIDYEPQFIKR